MPLNEPDRNHYEVNGDVAYLTIYRRDGSKHVVTFDADDLDRVKAEGFWHVMPNASAKGGTRVQSEGDRLLNRVIMQTPANMVCGFVEKGGNDYRKSNLRNTTRSQTQKAQTRRKAGPISPYPYVRYRATHVVNPWLCALKHKGKSIHVGSFRTDAEAYAAYLAWAAKNRVEAAAPASGTPGEAGAVVVVGSGAATVAPVASVAVAVAA